MNIIIKKITVIGLALVGILTAMSFSMNSINVEAATLYKEAKMTKYECIFPTTTCSADKSMLVGIASYFYYIAGAIAVLVIVWGGYQYMTDAGNGKEGGMKSLKRGVIGLLIVIAAPLIMGLSRGVIDKLDFATVEGNSPGETTVNVIARILDWVIPLAGISAVLFLVYGGFLITMSGGDSTRTQKGRDAVKNAVIGLIIIIIAFAIKQSIISIYNEMNLTKTK